VGAIGGQGKNGSAKLPVATLEARQDRKFYDEQPILPSRQELDYLPPSTTSAMLASPMEVFYNRPRARQSLGYRPCSGRGFRALSKLSGKYGLVRDPAFMEGKITLLRS